MAWVPVVPEEEKKAEATKSSGLKVEDTAVDVVRRAKTVCYQPVQVIGVQKESPVAWSPTGDRLAFVSRNSSLYVCDAEKHEDGSYGVHLQSILSGHQHEVEFISFHPKNPHMMVTGGRDGLYVWNLNDTDVPRKIEPITNSDAHESDVLCCLWLFDGEILVTGSRDTNIKIWDVSRGFECLETMYGHKAAILTLTWSPETHSLYSAGRDSTIKKWDISTLFPSVIRKRDDDGSITCNLIANLDGHRGDVVTLTCSSNGRMLFSGARDNTIKIWDCVMHREMRTIMGHMADVRRLILFSNDQYLYSASLDGTLKLWKLLEEEEGNLIELTEEDIERDREAADKKALDDILYGASISDHSARVEIFAAKDELITTIQAHSSDVVAMELNPMHPMVATTSHNELKVWDFSNIVQPIEFAGFVGHSDAVTATYLTQNDQQLFTASRDFAIHQYDVSSIRRISKFQFTSSVLAMVVSPTEEMVYGAGNDYVIRGFPLKSEPTSDNVVEFIGHSGRVYCLAVSPDGETMVSGAHDYSICVWKLGQASVSVSPKQKIEAHQGHVLSLKFNDPSGAVSEQMVASCGNDHAIKVWKVKKNKLSSKWSIPDAHASVVSCVTWGRAASSTALFSGGWDYTIKIWTPSKAAPSSPTETLRGHKGRVTQLETTKDGLVLVSTSADGTAMCWNAVQPYEAICCYVGAEPSWTDGAVCSLSVGNTVFATGFEDGMINVWPLKKPDEEDPHNLFVTTHNYLSSKKSTSVRLSLVPGSK